MNRNNGANLGFENKLWEMADKMRGHMDPGEYKHVLRKDYSRPTLDKTRLGELVKLVGDIDLKARQSGVQDPLGRVYEYFLGRFAAAEGKGGGEFYTPQCVVQLLVAMIEPFRGRVYDPCCGSGGMFVQSEKFVEEHGGKLGDIAIYGQESIPTTWKLARMNLANPPFNMSDWGGERLNDDPRWKCGVPPAGNANCAWIQHFIHHLAPNGIGGFVMANGSLSTSTNAELAIRKGVIEDDLVDCIVALPGQLFYTTQIPVSLWFVTRNKKANPRRGFRDRQGETLFIDGRRMGHLVDRVHRELRPEEIRQIAGVYHAWKKSEGYEEKPGWWKSATVEHIREHGYVLTPGRYVGAEEVEDDGVPFEEKMVELTAKLYEQFGEAHKLEAEIKKNLEVLGYGG